MYKQKRKVRGIFLAASLGICFGLLIFSVTVLMWSKITTDEDAGDLQDNFANMDVRESESTVFDLEWPFSSDSTSLKLDKVSKILSQSNAMKLKRLIARSTTSEWSPRLRSLQKLIVGTLAQKAPKAALDSVWQFPPSRKSNLIKIVFQIWAVQNIQEAITEASFLLSPYRDIAFRSILFARDDMTVEQLSDTTSEVNFQIFLDEWVREIEVLDLLKQPDQAFHVLVSDDIANRDQLPLLIRAVEAWQSQIGMSVLNILHESLNPSEQLLFQNLATRVIESNPALALQFTESAPRDRQRTIGRMVVQVWNEMDVVQAFQAVNDIENVELRSNLMFDQLIIWSNLDPNSVLESIQQIPRTERATATNYALRNLVKTDSSSAFRWFEALKTLPGAVIEDTEFEMIDAWAQVEPALVLEWMQDNTERGSERRARLMVKVLRHYALVEPEQALELALTEERSPFESSVGMEADVIDAIVTFGDIEDALPLLMKVREPARSRSFIRVGSELLKVDRSAEAFELAKSLPEEEKLDYFARVMQSLVYRDVPRLISTFAKLPSLDIKSTVARYILSDTFALKQYFTTAQIEAVRVYVIE